MKKSIVLALLSIICFLFFGGMNNNHIGASNAQYHTPTPQADGKILYTVKEGDTCLSISYIHNISVNQLIVLNNLPPACDNLQIGQQLIIAIQFRIFLPAMMSINSLEE